MQEIYEFRVQEQHASRLFAPNEGKKLGWTKLFGDKFVTVRKIELSADDPKFKRVGELNDLIKKEPNGFFFAGWNIHRRYAAEEIKAAELFQLRNAPAFEPTGEECGTVYDETIECLTCGAGRKQVSPLRLNLRKIPKAKDLVRTIANEWVVSQRLVNALVDANMSGVEFQPVHHQLNSRVDEPMEFEKTAAGREIIQSAADVGIELHSAKFYFWLNRKEQREIVNAAHKQYLELLQVKDTRSTSPLPHWYQLIVKSKPVKIAQVTKTGINPFDDDAAGKYRCPFGHTAGFTLLSELYIERNSWDGCDIAYTSQLVGEKGDGLIRPRPLILISPRIREILIKEKVKGLDIEIAHLV
jgi:hypothetical protein